EDGRARPRPCRSEADRPAVWHRLPEILLVSHAWDLDAHAVSAVSFWAGHAVGEALAREVELHQQRDATWWCGHRAYLCRAGPSKGGADLNPVTRSRRDATRLRAGPHDELQGIIQRGAALTAAAVLALVARAASVVRAVAQPVR